MAAPDPQFQPFRVVIAGGGIAALEATAALQALAADRVETVLLSPGDRLVLPQATVGEPFDHRRPVDYPLERLARDLRFEHHRDRFRWVDPAARVVHTTLGDQLEYDALLLALGARRRPRFRDALTLTPERLTTVVGDLLGNIDAGLVRTVALVVPSQPSWPLPVYELALRLAAHAPEADVDLKIHLITPEDAPLAVLGANASRQISYLLSAHGIQIHCGQHCQVHEPGLVWMHPSGAVLRPDVILALPELFGPSVPGVTTTAQRGFLSVDRHGAVKGMHGIFAAGDATDIPVKHGSLAAQQADAAAATIAALAGAAIDPQPVRPFIQALMLGARDPIYIHAQLAGEHGAVSEVSMTPLWSPANKLDARYLAPYLAGLDREHLSI